jgi:cytoskeleton protein RodZ
MNRPGSYGPEIGASLRDARRRLGLEVKEVEERTKIRARYLRALESEEWEALPGPAYVRGFLRTYGQVLGLDGEMLADEYRRRHEAPAAAMAPASDSVLERRRRTGRESPSRAPLIGGVVLAAVVGLLALGLLTRGGGDQDEGDRGQRQGGQQSRGGGGGGGQRNQGGPRRAIEIQITALTGVEVCLVEGSETVRIDGQVLAAGAEEEFGPARRYRLDLQSGGAIRIRAGGERERLETSRPVSLNIDSRGIREVRYRGDDCS